MSARLTVLAVGLALAAGAAQADETPPVSLAAVYTADLTAVRGGPAPRSGRFLDNLDLTFDADLEQVAGWKGATLHAYVLNNSGGAPNDVAGTLQGVDNIEVTTPRLRLFELWVEQAAGPATLRAGLYNLNSEFYVNDSAAGLIAPPFGIGSELAATGPNGPSIFPSTALGARLNVQLDGGYLRVAVLNAMSGVIGDPGGVDWSFGDGVLAIGEAGVEGPVRLSAGAWRYSRKQDDIRAVDASGAPLRRTAQGAYVLGEARVAGTDEGPATTAFVRAGASDARTTPFKGGWQAGLKVERLIASRPDGVLSVGVQQGVLSGAFRANLRDGGARPGRAESGVEITWADKIGEHVTLQPDLQWIRHAGGERGAKDRWVAALRVKIELSRP